MTRMMWAALSGMLLLSLSAPAGATCPGESPDAKAAREITEVLERIAGLHAAEAGEFHAVEPLLRAVLHRRVSTTVFTHYVDPDAPVDRFGEPLDLAEPLDWQDRLPFVTNLAPMEVLETCLTPDFVRAVHDELEATRAERAKRGLAYLNISILDNRDGRITQPDSTHGVSSRAGVVTVFGTLMPDGTCRMGSAQDMRPSFDR